MCFHFTEKRIYVYAVCTNMIRAIYIYNQIRITIYFTLDHIVVKQRGSVAPIGLAGFYLSILIIRMSKGRLSTVFIFCIFFFKKSLKRYLLKHYYNLVHANSPLLKSTGAIRVRHHSGRVVALRFFFFPFHFLYNVPILR